MLRVSPYPDGFPREYQVAYDPGNRDVTVDLELPPRGVVPAVRAYRYVKARDAVEPVPRQDNEITQAHERLVACVALRALHEIFGAIPAELVQAVALTGWVRSVDPATGAPVRPRVLAMRAERPVFDDPGPRRGRPDRLPGPSQHPGRGHPRAAVRDAPTVHVSAF